MVDLSQVSEMIANGGDLGEAFKLLDQWEVETDQQLAEHQAKLDATAEAVNGLNEAVEKDL